MKQTLTALALLLALLVSGCTHVPLATQPSEDISCRTHADSDNNDICDHCGTSVIVVVDFYSINDLHGKVADAPSHPGVDELTTYIKTARKTNDHVILLSAGDMWQGSSESNLTHGNLMTDWMNGLDFTAMTLGNHEYDWGELPIQENAEMAEFPFLAINIYDRETNKQVEYCQSSVVVDCGEVQVGIIGAIGNCYSSIASDKVKDIYFKTGAQLTQLVKDESQKLRSEGVDFIVYVLHDGFGQSKTGTVSSGQLSSYYDVSLSDGYVDLVFEGHSHKQYLLQDAFGVYHLQGGGDNDGITHAEAEINFANGTVSILDASIVSTKEYQHLKDDPLIEELLNKYADEIAPADRVVGINSSYLGRDESRQLIADLYYQAGVERWGEEYNIALGGGFISVRDPGYLSAGEVTYGMLQALFPFDNELVLCSIKGSDLKSKFFNSTHYAYFISYGEYGEQIKNNIDPNGTYYVIVDSYTSTYGPNRLTEIARYDAGVYARDLLAEYIENGGLSS